MAEKRCQTCGNVTVDDEGRPMGECLCYVPCPECGARFKSPQPKNPNCICPVCRKAAAESGATKRRVMEQLRQHRDVEQTTPRYIPPPDFPAPIPVAQDVSKQYALDVMKALMASPIVDKTNAEELVKLTENILEKLL